MISRKKEHVKGMKIGKRGCLLVLPIVILLIFSATKSHQVIVEAAEQEAREEEEYEEERAKNLKDSEKAFKSSYLLTWYSAERVASAEYKMWGSEIKNNVYSYDVDKTLLKITLSQYTKLSQIDDDLKGIKKSLDKIKDNSEYESDDKIYDKAYSRLKKFYRFINNPSGSYLSFSTKYSELDDAVSESYDEIKELEH